jgi:hypothetical protein
MFPSPKKVSFRAPLTEDIHNNIYTLAHSDIDFTSSSTSALETLPSGHGHYVQQQQKHKRAAAAALPIRTPTSPACGDKRDSSSEDDSDSDICPSTPITRKSKKPREWVWTLGPINQITPPPSSSPIEDQSQSWPLPAFATGNIKYNHHDPATKDRKDMLFLKVASAMGAMAFFYLFSILPLLHLFTFLILPFGNILLLFDSLLLHPEHWYPIFSFARLLTLPFIPFTF